MPGTVCYADVRLAGLNPPWRCEVWRGAPFQSDDVGAVFTSRGTGAVPQASYPPCVILGAFPADAGPYLIGLNDGEDDSAFGEVSGRLIAYVFSHQNAPLTLSKESEKREVGRVRSREVSVRACRCWVFGLIHCPLREVDRERAA